MIDTKNIILATDSYKLNHWNQYPKNTEGVYSYFESRLGAEYPFTVFFGLQPILIEHLEGVVVTQEAIDEAATLAAAHFGNESYFNRTGWEHILNDHGGKLPLRIMAVPEGTPVPTGNVLMTVENTCPECYWLTNAVESVLTHAWYPSTVASLSRLTKLLDSEYLEQTAETMLALLTMLHDFGYRGASSHETAGMGGMAHLVNFRGTDTLPAMLFAQKYYDAQLDSLGFSVAATEHSIMTSLGPDGELKVLDQLLEDYPTGILSVVSDSYDIYKFVDAVCDRAEQIKAREGGIFVVRPDSITKQHRSPEDLVVWILERLGNGFGYEMNSKGYKVLDPSVRVLWGDGIDLAGIDRILFTAVADGWSAENLIFGMGGGLLQKVNRDTQRFAFKSSAQKRDGVWNDVWKKPIDLSKASKRGRLALIEYDGKLTTVSDPFHKDNLLETVFENGEILKRYSFAEVRDNAEIRNAVPTG